MNIISRTIVGISSIILGLYITFTTILDKPENWLWGVGIGIFFIVIGIFIFFNKKEDNIEKIKNSKINKK